MKPKLIMGSLASQAGIELAYFDEKKVNERYRAEYYFGFPDVLGYDGCTSDFSKGRAAVHSRGKRGYIDASGKVVIPYQFKFAAAFGRPRDRRV